MFDNSEQGDTNDAMIQRLATIYGQLSNIAAGMDLLGKLLNQGRQDMPGMARQRVNDFPVSEVDWGEESWERAIKETLKEEEEPEFQYQDSEVHCFKNDPQDYETMSLLEEEDIDEEEDVVSEAGRDDCDSRYVNFSGHDQGPEAYLRWERDMDGWFQENLVPEKEKTFIAEETLVEEAYLQWDQEANFRLDYGLPDRTWEGMKQFMHQKFVEEPSTEPYHTRWKIPQEPRRWITVAPSKKSSVPEAMKLTKKKLQVPNVKESKEAPQFRNVEAKAQQGEQATEPELRVASVAVNTIQYEADQIERSDVPEQSRGVILSYLLKGEPPDMGNITKLQAYRGKTLNSQRRMKANLLSLGAGYTVLRSKPFEEGEYDVEIKSPPLKEHIEDTKKLIKTLEENQFRRTKDICFFLGAYLSNQKELICESTCSQKLTHQGITDSWIHTKPSSELEVIEVTSWQTGFQTPSANGPEIELHSPTVSQSRPLTTWRMLMDLSWFHQAQETKKHPKETQVITKFPQHVYSVSFKGNAKPDRFSILQTYTWRPGELSKHSGEPHIILPCTSIQRIRRILSSLHLPYMEPSTFLPFLLTQDLEAVSTFKKVPRQHLFMPKLSRYKESRAYLD